jgi:hypothetical protein
MAISQTPRRVQAARVLGVVADAVQLGLLPLFAEGWASPLNDALDVVVGVAMVALVGWHWAFLPAFLSELIPIWDLVPSWTAAVLIATRNTPIEVAPEGPATATSLEGGPARRSLED